MSPVLAAGTVYGVLLNAQAEWTAWQARMREAPYQAPPQAPVLYIKTANTWCASGAAAAVPADGVEVGASLALVVARAACRVRAQDALAHVAGYVLVNDLALPHASYYRPALPQRNRDGFLGIGPRLATPQEVPDPNRLELHVRIDGRLRQRVALQAMRRHAAQLLAEVSAFMTLHPGDALLLGLDAARPRARAGQRIAIEAPAAPALGVLHQQLVEDA